MTVATETNPVEELVGRLFMEGVGTMHLMSVYLGVRLGLFRALSDGGPQTSAQLAADSPQLNANRCTRSRASLAASSFNISHDSSLLQSSVITTS